VLGLGGCAAPAWQPPALPALPERTEQVCLAGATELPETLPAACFPGGDPGPDLVPFAPRSPLWTDGVDKERWLVLPDGATVGYAADGQWAWPDGAVLLKRFSWGAQTLETRAMLRSEGAWRFATWLADGSRGLGGEAIALDADHGRFDYLVPAAESCEACHVGGALGPRTDQLAGPVRYADGERDQLDALSAWGLFDGPLPADRPALVPPDDPAASVADRARSWLHGNCAHCHRPGGWTPPDMEQDLRWTTPMAEASLCQQPVDSDLAPDAGDVRIAPGEPDGSALWNRIASDDTTRMPPTGTVVHDPTAELVRAWIEGMGTGCE
jgi:hypothetical protein